MGNFLHWPLILSLPIIAGGILALVLLVKAVDVVYTGIAEHLGRKHRERAAQYIATGQHARAIDSLRRALMAGQLYSDSADVLEADRDSLLQMATIYDDHDVTHNVPRLLEHYVQLEQVRISLNAVRMSHKPEHVRKALEQKLLARKGETIGKIATSVRDLPSLDRIDSERLTGHQAERSDDSFACWQQITPGMTRDAVLKALGQPSVRMTGQDFMKKLGHVAGSSQAISKFGGMDHWLYRFPDFEYQIVLYNDRVTSACKVGSGVPTEQKPEAASGSESTGERVSPSAFKTTVHLSPLWVAEFGQSKVNLQGPPEEFFSHAEVPLVWPDDTDHVSKMEKDDQDFRQRWLRFVWYIAYLHHTSPDAVVRVLEVAMHEKHHRKAVLAGISLFLPELLAQREAAIRNMAAKLTWECDDASVKQVVVALSNTGAIPSGIKAADARRAIELLRDTCPPERHSFFEELATERLGLISKRVESGQPEHSPSHMPQPNVQQREQFKQATLQLLQKHVTRLIQTYERQAHYTNTIRVVRKILDRSTLDVAAGMIAAQFFDAAADGTCHHATKSQGALFTATSVLPAYEASSARGFFAPAGYMAFLESIGFSRAPLNHQSAAHWTFCGDLRTGRVIAHLTFLPDLSEGSKEHLGAILAQDLMTPTEKALAGLS